MKYLAVLLLACLSCFPDDADDIFAKGMAELQASQSDHSRLMPAIKLLIDAEALFEKAGNNEKAANANSSIYWARKRMTVADLGISPPAEVSAKLESVSKPIPDTQAADMLSKAEAFAKAHSEDHLAIAIRFFEIADRFPLSEHGRRAMKTSLDEMQKSTVAVVKLKLDSVKGLPPDKAFASGTKVVMGFIADDDYAAAEAAAIEVNSNMIKFGIPNLVNRAAYNLSWVKKLKTEFAALVGDIATLRNDPENPAANTALGKFFCLSKRDWVGGIPNLLRCSDKALANLARLESSSPATDADFDALSEGWQKIDPRRSSYWRLRISDPKTKNPGRLRESYSKFGTDYVDVLIVGKWKVADSAYGDYRIEFSPDGSCRIDSPKGNKTAKWYPDGATAVMKTDTSTFILSTDGVGFKCDGTRKMDGRRE